MRFANWLQGDSRRGVTGGVLWAMLLVLGCRKPSGPELLPVEGSVTLSGRSLESGAVSLYRDGSGDGELRHCPVGTIESDGRYQIFFGGRAGCPAGSYRVVVFANAVVGSNAGAHAGLPKSLIDGRYNRAETTPLRLDVRPGGASGDYDLRLVP